jgi:hypothetical protein
VPDASLGNLRAGKVGLDHLSLQKPVGTLTLYLNDLSVTDLWLGLAWGKE